MTTYFDLAQALVGAGYVSDADIQAAADVLADALIIEAAEVDLDMVEVDKEIMDDAAEQALEDRDTVVAAAAVIDAAYTDAAAALLAAELIDEAETEAVAALMADLWADDDDDV